METIEEDFRLSKEEINYIIESSHPSCAKIPQISQGGDLVNYLERWHKRCKELKKQCHKTTQSPTKT